MRSSLGSIFAVVLALTAEAPALAAEQSNAFGQHKLAVIYANGDGVPQDDAEALRRYRLAAAQHDAWGQYNLGVM